MMSGMDFCISTEKGKVLAQSESCHSICGERLGTVCREGCQQYLKFKRKDKDTVLLKNREINGSHYDILRYFEDSNQKILMIKKEMKPSFLDDLKKLTHKEQEVAQLIVKGYSNQEILEELNILKSTLKTHINRIYQKMDESFVAYRKMAQQN